MSIETLAASSESFRQNDTAVLDFAVTDFSFGIWAVPYQGGTTYAMLSKARGALGGPSMVCRVASLDRLQFILRNISDVETSLSSANSSLTLNVLHFLLFVYKGGSSSMEIFIDGVSAASSATHTGGMGDTNGDFVLAARESGQYFDGMIHSVTTWARAITANEALSIYRERMPGYLVVQKDVVTTWPCEALVSGTTVPTGQPFDVAKNNLPFTTTGGTPTYARNNAILRVKGPVI